MQIELRADGSAVISGYVNAVCRDSRPIITAEGKCVEQIEAGVFKRAIERAENVDFRLNHYTDRNYASTKEGTLKLREDSIGLYAEAVVTDEKLLEKAKNKEFVGWSFGAYMNDTKLEERADNIPRRHVKDLDLFEVSIIDKRKNPCYVGTSVEERAEGDVVLEERSLADSDVNLISHQQPIDYSCYEERIKKCKGE